MHTVNLRCKSRYNFIRLQNELCFTLLLQLGLVFQSAPKLQFLNFGFNNLSGIVLPTIPKEFPRIDTLKTLILIGTEAPWAVIWFFLDHAKNISELHLSRNNYTQVDLADQAHDHDQENASLDKSGSQFGQVVKLMFDNNPISSWNEISKLGNWAKYIDGFYAGVPCCSHFLLARLFLLRNCISKP